MKTIFLIDVDDTILDFHGVSDDALKVAFAESSIIWTETLAAKFRAFNTSLWEALERKELTREALMRERFVWFFEEIGMKDVDGYAVNRAFVSYISDNPRYLQGAEAFLAKLSKLGRIFFVTNGTEYIQKKRFNIVKLWGKAENTFISQKVGFDKPAKEYTDYIVSHVPNFDREKAVWIGDSLSADIKAANEAKITSIWYNPLNKGVDGPVQPQYIAENYEEIFAILQKIN